MDEELDFVEAVARLVTVAWVELYVFEFESERQLPTAGAAASAVDLAKTCSIQSAGHAEQFTLFVGLLEHNDIDVSRSVLPVLQNMLGILKRQSQGGGAPMTGIAALHGFRVIEHAAIASRVAETDAYACGCGRNRFRRSLQRLTITVSHFVRYGLILCAFARIMRCRFCATHLSDVVTAACATRKTSRSRGVPLFYARFRRGLCGQIAADAGEGRTA